MQRVLLTGMSGTGKSTVIDRLSAQGYKAIDLDYGGWTEVRSHPDGEETLWLEDPVAGLLAEEDADVLFISGAAAEPNEVLRAVRPCCLAQRAYVGDHRTAPFANEQPVREASD